MHKYWVCFGHSQHPRPPASRKDSSSIKTQRNLRDLSFIRSTKQKSISTFPGLHLQVPGVFSLTLLRLSIRSSPLSEPVHLENTVTASTLMGRTDFQPNCNYPWDQNQLWNPRERQKFKNPASRFWHPVCLSLTWKRFGFTFHWSPTGRCLW